jgi:DNA replication licensing factor MCM2
VVRSHIKHHPEVTEEDMENMDRVLGTEAEAEDDELETIPQDLLRKYLMYSKEKIHPKLNYIDKERISKLYGDLRRESLVTGSIPITVRHVESILRCAEANARMHLRDYVQQDDVNMAMRVILESFIGTQKFSVMRSMKSTFSRYLSYQRSPEELMLFFLKQLVNEQIGYLRGRGLLPEGRHITEVEVEEKRFSDRAKSIDVRDVKTFYKSRAFIGHNFSYDPKKKVIIQSF